LIPCCPGGRGTRCGLAVPFRRNIHAQRNISAVSRQFFFRRARIFRQKMGVAVTGVARARCNAEWPKVTSELLSVFNGAVELVSELEEPDRPGQPASARDGNRRPELPDPDERSRLYDLTCAHVDAEQPSYAAEVPRFQQMWADHLHRWPADHQPRTPLQLSPDRDAEATAAIARVREAEPAITADVLKVEQQNTCAARLEGIDHRLKGEPRLKEKVAEQLEATPEKTTAEVLRQIPDAIRFTFCLQTDAYARGYYAIKQQLERCGHEMYLGRNFWANQEYKGVNTRWATQEGQRFEVQFHTPDSFHAKHTVTHDSYERIRNPVTSRSEQEELHSFQQEVSSKVNVPNGATEIADYKKEGL
jgi:hypothetical protein